MPNTTNYNWATPADTDLVKDGAAAIRTLGSSIDTTTKNLNPQTTTGALAYRSATANVNTALAIGTAGQVLTVNSGATAPEWQTPAGGGGGLVYITKSTFSGSNAVNFDNCFSATYDNYLITGEWTTSGTAMVNFRYRTSGSNNTNNNYVVSGFNNIGTGVVSENATLTALEAGNNADNTCGFAMEVISPNLSERTVALFRNSTSGASYANICRYYNNVFTATTVFDGFSFTPASGTFSGTITIYGYALS